MSTQKLKDWFWTLIKIFYYLILFVLVVIIIIRFNLIPSFILTFLRDARDNYLIVRLLYYDNAKFIKFKFLYFYFFKIIENGKLKI